MFRISNDDKHCNRNPSFKRFFGTFCVIACSGPPLPCISIWKPIDKKCSGRRQRKKDKDIDLNILTVEETTTASEPDVMRGGNKWAVHYHHVNSRIESPSKDESKQSIIPSQVLFDSVFCFYPVAANKLKCFNNTNYICAPMLLCL